MEYVCFAMFKFKGVKKETNLYFPFGWSSLSLSSEVNEHFYSKTFRYPAFQNGGFIDAHCNVVCS